MPEIMAQPVRRIQEKGSQTEVSVNLLPCKIHHDGSIGSIQGHWTLEKSEGRYFINSFCVFPGARDEALLLLTL